MELWYLQKLVELLRENNAKGGLNFDYNDIMLITSNLANGTNSKNVFLGMANRTIDRMWVQKDDNGYDAVGMGKFRSVVDEGQNWNLRVNEELMFETPVTNIEIVCRLMLEKKKNV